MHIHKIAQFKLNKHCKKNELTCIKLLQELPQVETKLKNMIHAWEESSGEPFLLNGNRASLVLEEQWENRKLEKEREKQERVCWSPIYIMSVDCEKNIICRCPLSIIIVLTTSHTSFVYWYCYTFFYCVIVYEYISM